jgi:hypothetical protein
MGARMNSDGLGVTENSSPVCCYFWLFACLYCCAKNQDFWHKLATLLNQWLACAINQGQNRGEKRIRKK